MIFTDLPRLKVSLLLDNNKENLKVFIRNESPVPVTLLDAPGTVTLWTVRQPKPTGLIICPPCVNTDRPSKTLLPGGSLFYAYSLDEQYSRFRIGTQFNSRIEFYYKEPGAVLGKRIFVSEKVRMHLGKLRRQKPHANGIFRM